MKIAVTGGSGFIGRATLAWAERCGHDAWSFDRAHGDDVLGDLSRLGGAEVVIHLAGLLGTAELFADVERAVTANVLGTWRVLEWCERNAAGYVGITMPQVFPSVYTATKVCATRLATAWHLFRGVPIAHVRAFNAYGPGQRHGPGHPQKFLPTFATRAWRGLPLPIWGDGTQTMDLIHVEDLGRLLVEAVSHGDDVTFDGGTGVAVSVNQVAAFVLEVTGSTAGVEHLPMRDGEIPQQVVAVGDGWDRFGWQPRLDWDRVAAAVASYR